MQVIIPVFPGVEELDAIAPLEVFGLARQVGLPVEVRLASPQPASRVKGIHGVTFADLAPFDADSPADLVIVPGGAWLSGGNTGVRLAVSEGTLPALLQAQYQRGATIASVCTGAFLLQASGLLTNTPATTHHLAQEDLRALGVDTRTDRILDAGRIVTAGGITSGLDLALHLVARTFGPDRAEQIRDLLEYTQ